MARKIHIQLIYNGDNCYWLITDKKKRFGGVHTNGYENYLCEKIASTYGYKVCHSSLEEISRVNDLNRKETIVTYTLLVK